MSWCFVNEQGTLVHDGQTEKHGVGKSQIYVGIVLIIQLSSHGNNTDLAPW